MVVAGESAFVAVDLGAESGRAVLGRFEGERMTLEEVHRFPNRPIVAALGRTEGNVSKAADMLGVSRPTLYDLMHRLVIK